MSLQDRIQKNRETWDKVVLPHVKSAFYNVATFLDGKTTLDPIELQEMGDVKGQDLLHLQCHFGLDTLSWAREGACVTGVDISPEAIRQAKGLSEKAGIEANFVEASVDKNLPATLQKSFDIVYTGGGALCWLPDMDEWAQLAHALLKPGGRLYLREFHPFMGIFDDASQPQAMVLRYPYFKSAGVMHFDDGLQYAVSGDEYKGETWEWPHSMSEILQALLDAGFQLRQVHEHAECSYQALPFLEEQNGRWTSHALPGGLPLMFSLMAEKPAGSA